MGQGTRRGTSVLVLAVVAIFASVGTAFAQTGQPPAPLTGETLSAVDYPEPQPTQSFCAPGLQGQVCVPRVGDIEITSFQCTTGTEGGTASYKVTGVAAGPYPGTFEETGTIVFAPGIPFPLAPEDPGPPFGQPITQFTAKFTIDSPAGQVTGTKKLAVNRLSAGDCRNESGGELVSSIALLNGTYEALIKTPAGTFRDEGITAIDIDGFTRPGEETFGYFVETYVSTLTAPVLVEPVTKEECKGKGFKNFPNATNQGDCVSFVATDAKNELGQNIPRVP